MTALLLAAILIGQPPVPDCRLIVGCHSGDWQTARVHAELANDLWVNANFAVTFEERDFLQPRFKFSRFGEYVKFPCPEDSPAGPWCTKGLAIGWLKPELETYLKEREAGFNPNREDEPEWSPLAADWKRNWFYNPNREEQQFTVWPAGEFKFMAPVPAPRADEGK